MSQHSEPKLCSTYSHNGSAADRTNRARRGSEMEHPLFMLSHQARHGGGGTAVVRRKLFEGRRLARDGLVSTTLRDQRSQDLELGDIGGPSRTMSGPDIFLSAVSMSSQILNELSYKDLYTLKELSLPMSKKKELRAKIFDDHGKLGNTSEWSPSSGLTWRRFKENFRDTHNQFQLWGSSMREIEGRFGHGIGSYFSFLRWLFLVNLLTFLLPLVFIVVPTVVFEILGNSTFITNSDTLVNVSSECAYSPYDPQSINSFTRYLIWWFTGQGFMENTLLFYGYYSNALTSARHFNFHYNMPLAYLLVAFFYLLLNLILLTRRAAEGLKSSTSNSDQATAYVNKVFCGWDYCFTDKRAADWKHGHLKYEIMTAIEEERNQEKHKNRTKKERFILYSQRIIVNLIVVVFLVGALVGIFFAAQYSLQNTSKNNSFFVDLLVTYMTSLFITFLNFIAPLLFEVLVTFEEYTPEVTIRITLIRAVLLRLVSIVFLYVAVYVQTNCDTNNVNVFNPICNICIGVECWETHLGQEMYKLALLNFFIVLGLTFIVEFPRTLIVTHLECYGFSERLGQQEFSIPANVLDLVYIQTVGWIGSFYAPLLPVMVILQFFIFFYLKKLTLLYNCRPGSKAYQACKTGTFYYLILLFGFLVAAFPVAIGVGIMEPSKDCGPFRLLPRMFYVITASMEKLPMLAQQTFWFLGTPGFSVFIILILSLILHYYFTLALANREMISVLKIQLTLEGKDKHFLLSRVNQWSAKLKAVGVSAPKLGKKDEVKQRFLAGGKTDPDFESLESEYHLAPQESDKNYVREK